MSDTDDLDALVARVDPDRWLASRFVADPEARADLVALYAFNHELARAAEAASQPLAAEIRLTWWREALDEIFAGRPIRRHPTAEAMARAVQRRDIPQERLEGLVAARMRDIDGWPLRPGEVESYIDATAGGLMAAAALMLDRNADPYGLRHAARAWGLAGLSRLGGRLPPSQTAEALRREVLGALDQANADLRRLPVAAFPAVAYAALSRPYAQGKAPSDLGRRLRITWAAARGRI